MGIVDFLVMHGSVRVYNYELVERRTFYGVVLLDWGTPLFAVGCSMYSDSGFVESDGYSRRVRGVVDGNR